MTYYSDRHGKPVERKIDTIGPTVWAGMVAQIQAQVATGALAERYPEMCPDGAGPIASDQKMLAAALQAEVPAASWPLETMKLSANKFTYESYAPDTPLVLDIIEFFHKSISKPIQGTYHAFFKHYHLTFDRDFGKQEFRDSINIIFQRNGVAFELKDSGMIERIVNPVLAEALQSTVFQTPDETLNKMLEESCTKILNPRLNIRKEALERLWDAWERLKSTKNSDKKTSIRIILDSVATEPYFRKVLDDEANQLTGFGNKLQIRHTEVDKIPVADAEYVDYLFHRLFALVVLILKKSG